MAKKKLKIDKHILIPKHSKVGEKERSQILEKYNTELRNFPKILRSDAAIVNLDVKNGDIIKIIRKSQTAGEAVFYRVVQGGD